MGLCITAGILGAEVTNPVLAQFLVSLLSGSLQGTHRISCLLLACEGSSCKGNLMALSWKLLSDTGASFCGCHVLLKCI